MEKIKNYLILGLALTVMVLFLLKGCDGKPSTGGIITGSSDTTIVETHDTIRAVDTVFTTKWLKSPRIISETPYNPNGLENESVCKMYRTYADSVDDANQTLYYTAKVVGRLDSIKIDYKLKVPLIINNTKTISILRVDTLVRPNKWNLYGGLEVGGSKTSFNVSPYITLNAKRNTFTFRYGVLDQTYNIGVGIRLIKSKK